MSGIYEMIYSYIDAEYDEYFWECIDEIDAECAECFDCYEDCELFAA